MSENHIVATSRWRRSIRALSPFFGLLFIIAVFALYDMFFLRTTMFPQDWESYPRGLIPVPFLKALGLERFGELFAWVNLKTIASQTAIIAIGALGMTIVIIAGGIDLSPGSAIALCTVTIALCLRGFDPPFFGRIQTGPTTAIVLGIGVAVLVGFVNGVLITRLRIVPFIVTLGMMSMARGTAKLMSSSTKVSAGEKTWINELLVIQQDSPFWGLPAGVWVLLALAALTAVLLRYTVFGRYIFALGSNESTARLCGLRVERQKIFIYTIAGLFIGVAGVMEFSQLNVGDPSTAMGKELEIIAAVVIGGGSLSGGKGSVLGTLIGAFIIGFLDNGCTMYDLPNPVQEIVVGAIIIAAAAVDQLQQRRRT